MLELFLFILISAFLFIFLIGPVISIAAVLIILLAILFIIFLPIILILGWDMKRKGYIEHTYKFLGMYITITNKSKENKNEK